MIYKGVDYNDSDRPPIDRRFRVKPRKVHTVSKMWELHDEIARRVLLGQKGTVIAEALSCSAQTISNVRNSPVVQDKLSLMRGARDAYTIDIARDIQEFAPKALDLLKNIVEGKGLGASASPALRAKEANNFVDRAGFTAVRREHHMHSTLSTEQLDEIKARARSVNGPVVEAEYEDNTTAVTVSNN